MTDFFMTIGIPSSGKTTLREKYVKNYPNLCVISPDEIRFKLLDYKNTGIAFDPLREREVWNKVYDDLRACAKQKRPIFFDATNVNRLSRKDTINILNGTGYNKIAIRIHIEPELAIHRQKKRERKVPDSVIFSKHYEIEEPTKEEFDKIIHIRNYASMSECNELKGTWQNGRCKIWKII